MCRSIVSHVASFVWLSALCLAGASDAVAQEAGSISGRVLTESGEPAADATVTIAELRRRTRVEADGVYVIRDVRPGVYRIEAGSPRYGIAVSRVTVAPGARVEHDLVLDLLLHAEPITVSAAPGSRGLDEVAQPVGVVEGRDLVARREATLGETLSDEPGVNSTYFGPGASRPVIRGLGGDRIRILEGGVGTGDASTTSPDHAISHDPLSAARIEIVRGPATLLYGSSAIGGVVNIIDGRIPRFDLAVPITGSLELRGGTVANERSGALSAS
ncbi:MAG: TonB-dependent receptor plug domain-containing protein, partial [Gemmatimonadota bacterium]